MGSYSKKYIAVKDESKTLFLTWETGYNNLKLYSEGRLVKTINSPGELMNGVTFIDEELNDVLLKFSSGAPIIIQITANGLKYYPQNNAESGDGADFSGLVSVFWVLATLSLIGAIIAQTQISGIVAITQGVYDIIIITIYVIAAIFLNKKKVWAYYLGGITFLATSSLTFLVYYFAGLGIGSIINLVIRGFILLYIARHYKDTKLVSKPIHSNPNLLDNNEESEFDF